MSAFWAEVAQWARTKASRNGDENQTDGSSSIRPEQVQAQARVLSSIVDILRDQVAAQQDTANTNEFSANGLMAASLAMVVALMILKATSTAIGGWWWYPMPFLRGGDRRSERSRRSLLVSAAQGRPEDPRSSV